MLWKFLWKEPLRTLFVAIGFSLLYTTFCVQREVISLRRDSYNVVSSKTPCRYQFRFKILHPEQPRPSADAAVLVFEDFEFENFKSGKRYRPLDGSILIDRPYSDMSAPRTYSGPSLELHLVVFGFNDNVLEFEYILEPLYIETVRDRMLSSLEDPARMVLSSLDDDKMAAVLSNMLRIDIAPEMLRQPFGMGSTDDPLQTNSPSMTADYERLPGLTGPREAAIPRRSVVAIAVGERSKQFVQAALDVFGLERYTFVLFHYDLTTWDEFEWYHHVISVRALGQMKWWFIKRFLHPDIVAPYPFVWILDDDVTFGDGFEPAEYEKMMDDYAIDMSQPANVGEVNHKITLRQDSTASSGRWTDFVECGPVVVFRRDTWRRCVWPLLQPDITSGYGYDALWHNFCGSNATAVIDRFYVRHESLKAASGQSPRRYRPYAEVMELSRRFPQVRLTTFTDYGALDYSRAAQPS